MRTRRKVSASRRSCDSTLPPQRKKEAPSRFTRNMRLGPSHFLPRLRWPNKAPEPTPGSVTIHADAWLAPAPVVAHLERWARDAVPMIKVLGIIGGTQARV